MLSVYWRPHRERVKLILFERVCFRPGWLVYLEKHSLVHQTGHYHFAMCQKMALEGVINVYIYLFFAIYNKIK
jgi:hypothetical protein